MSNDDVKPPSILSDYYRQPEIFISLPSGGQFYPEGTLEQSATGEIPVYPMTAKDDIIIKTPDALISGEAIVQIVLSCIPAIKDPWQMPASDVDFVLIAIRIASYGNQMEMELTCEKCKEEHNISLNLDHYIDKLSNLPFNEEQTTITYGEVKIHLKPLSYKELSLLQRKTFEEQQILQAAQTVEEMSETEREEMYSRVLANMTEINISTVSSGVQGIELPDGQLVVDKKEIIDFVNNSSVRLFNEITTAMEGIRDKTIIPPADVKCPKCELETEIPVIFDYSSFFV
tara:strand:- start:425 stop:1285 length:861 start_codon:yes stop_codon:yes gene_type:complete